MSSVTLTLPDDLAEHIRDLADRIPRTFEVALRTVLRADAPTVDAVDEIVQFLATLPTPEQILAYRASPAVEQRIAALLEKTRAEGLTEDEEREWQVYEYAAHLIRVAKANAAIKLRDREQR
ncbi:MAG: hypothetical protein R3B70_24610 [Polyangiaceae bacterium]